MDLQIGVVGLGAIGREHVQRLSEQIAGCKVVAVSEVNEEVGRKIAQQYDARFYADGEELIRSPEVQAVMVTTWDPAHAQYVMASIRAGKPVFCEKPLATEVEACEEILRAEQALGRRVVQVGFMRRYDPGYVELKKAIQEGKIGQPMMVHACHRNMSHAATMTSEMSIKNSGVHEIDVLRWLLEDEYVSGQVVLPRQSRISAEEGLQDPQIMMLRTKEGICIDVEISQSSGYGYDIQCEVVGDLGTARLPDPPSVITKTNCARTTAIMPDWQNRFVEAYQIELQDWVDRMRKGQEPGGASAWDGYAACLTAHVLGQCREEGGTAKEINLPPRPDFYK
ncbi:MAG: Gfo/Idh/MocA family oxidoreductase [Butyricicoccus sp.]|nr:Gfo/Idh/MocA family oxidoreductase [Butyricicoccus sp.]